MRLLCLATLRLMINRLATPVPSFLIFISLITVSSQEGAGQFDRCYDQSGTPRFCRPPSERLKIFNVTASNTGGQMIVTSGLDSQCIDPNEASNETALDHCPSPRCFTARCAVDGKASTSWRSKTMPSVGSQRAWLRLVFSRDYQVEMLEVQFPSAAARPALMHIKLAGSHSTELTFAPAASCRELSNCKPMPHDRLLAIQTNLLGITNAVQPPAFSAVLILFEQLRPKPANQFYSVSEVRVFGRCNCHGHANMCVNGSCQCEHNTAGDDCSRCLPLYNNRSWSAATPQQAISCQKCDCNNHSEECQYSPQHIGNAVLPGGTCVNCKDHTTGQRCGTCVRYFFENPQVPRSDTRACEACDCNPNGSKNASCNVTTGQCFCRPGYIGLKCDRCFSTRANYYSAPVWHETHMSARVCRLCKCDPLGSKSGLCSDFDGKCDCKSGVMGLKCDSCEDGYYNMTADGCSRCPCDRRGMSWCSNLTGVCRCKVNVIGARCNQCIAETDSLSADDPKGCSANGHPKHGFSTRNIIVLISALLVACFLLVVVTIALVRIWQKKKPGQPPMRRFASEQVLMQSRPMAAYASNGPCPDGGDTVNLRQISNCMIFENPLLSPTTPMPAPTEESGLVFLNETAIDLTLGEMQELGLIQPDEQTDATIPTKDPAALHVASVQRSASVKKVGPPKPARSPARSVHHCESLPHTTAATPKDLQQIEDAPPALPARNAIKASISVPQASSHHPPRSPKKPPRRLPLLPPSSPGPCRPLPPPPVEEMPFLPLHMKAERNGSTKRPSSTTAIDSLQISPEGTVERTAVTPQPRFSAPSLPQEFRVPPRSESNSPIPRRVVRRSRQRPRSSSMTALYTQPSKLIPDVPVATRAGLSTTERLKKAMSCSQVSADDDDDQVPTLPHRTSASYILMTGSDSMPQEGSAKETGHDESKEIYQYDKLKGDKANTYESINDNGQRGSPLYDSMPPVAGDTAHSYASLGQSIQEEATSSHQE